MLLMFKNDVLNNNGSSFSEKVILGRRSYSFDVKNTILMCVGRTLRLLPD